MGMFIIPTDLSYLHRRSEFLAVVESDCICTFVPYLNTSVVSMLKHRIGVEASALSGGHNLYL